ncbi:MAG: pyruvate kinase [Candidatus Njordarchaeales archaeon]
MRKTKIIATLGPSSMEEDIVTLMARRGADAFRLNFSHGTLEEKEIMIKMIRKAEEKVEKFIPIIADLRGPTIRLGVVDNDYYVNKGDSVSLINSEKGYSGNKEIPVPFKEVFSVLEEGDILLIDDGKVRIRVEKMVGERVVGTVLSEGKIRSRVTFIVQGKEPPLPALTDKDKKDVMFCIKHGVEFFALSFVRTREDVKELRDFLDDHGASYAKIISKIETKSAVSHLDEIIDQSDGVMIARGDLGMHFPLEEIPYIQERIAKRCLEKGKLSILATQILESMTENPMPTRAEVADVYTAVREGIGALMLSAETAIGKYPVEAVSWLDSILKHAEERISPPRVEGIGETIYDKFAKGLVLLAESINAYILAYTKGGVTANRISRYRPKVQAYIATSDKSVARQVNLLWGLTPVLTQETDLQKALSEVFEDLRARGIFKKGDIVIITVGMREGTTDLARIEILE